MFKRVQHWFETRRRVASSVALALGILVFSAVAAFAQTPIPTLALDPDVVTTGLFSGANIILVALGGIIFLIIGLSFGGKILEAVRNMVQGLRIG